MTETNPFDSGSTGRTSFDPFGPDAVYEPYPGMQSQAVSLPNPDPVWRQPYEGLAIASFVLSILTFWGFTSVLGIIFGHVALYRIRHRNLRGRGLALAGTIIGYTTLALTALFVYTTIMAAHQNEIRTQMEATQHVTSAVHVEVNTLQTLIAQNDVEGLRAEQNEPGSTTNYDRNYAGGTDGAYSTVTLVVAYPDGLGGDTELANARFTVTGTSTEAGGYTYMYDSSTGQFTARGIGATTAPQDGLDT